METIKVKSSDPASQGDFVVIDKDDYDEKVHVLYEEPKSKAAPKQPEK